MKRVKELESKIVYYEKVEAFVLGIACTTTFAYMCINFIVFGWFINQ